MRRLIGLFTSSDTPLSRYCASVCLLIIGLMPASSYAEKRVELYRLSQLVLDESIGLRQQATSKGLATVLLKVSGREQVLQHPLVKEALTKATAYLAQYSYSSSDKTITIAGDNRSASLLSLQYSPAAVQRLLQSAQYPSWPETRPEILLWVASDNKEKHLLDKQSLEVRAVKNAGDQRGVPIVNPLLDLADRKTLSATRLWAFDENAIQEASVRYGANGVLAGRLSSTSSGVWKGSFILLHKGQRTYLNEQAATAQNVAQKVVGKVANYFAGLEAIVVNDERDAPSMTIVVNTISRFEHYASLMKYLNSVPLVVGTTVSQVNGDQIVLELSYNGSADKLLTTLAGSDTLKPQLDEVNPVTPAAPNIAATFHWRKIDTQ